MTLQPCSPSAIGSRGSLALKSRMYSLIALSGLDLESPTSERPEILEKLLSAALATNDLKQICQAVDSILLRKSSVTRVAVAARIDRTTLYRAFRLRKGPSLDTMNRVIQVLGYSLIIKENKKHKFSNSERARSFTKAFQSQDTKLLAELFAAAFRKQDNFTAFAEEVGISREWLYRIFKGPKTPRFGTVVMYLNALGLRFSVERN
jgi:probable addiction module antidote protein